MKNLLFVLLCSLLSTPIFSQDTLPKTKSTDSIMVTIHLKHQKDKNLKEIGTILEKNEFWENFPPQSARVVSWYVMMGIGQVVTLKIPARDLRTLNLAIENGAWGAFDTEFYPTYDFEPIWKEKYESKR